MTDKNLTNYIFGDSKVTIEITDEITEFTIKTELKNCNLSFSTFNLGPDQLTVSGFISKNVFFIKEKNNPLKNTGIFI